MMRAVSLFLYILAFTITKPGIAQEPFHQAFKSDTKAPEGFRTNRNSYSAIMDVLDLSRPEVSDEQLEQLKEVPLEVIFSALGILNFIGDRIWQATIR